MSGWYLDSTRIFVTDNQISASKIISRLQPLGSKTIYHRFGKDSRIIKLKAYVVGTTDLNALHTMLDSDTTHWLYTPDPASGEFLIHSLNDTQVPCIRQTLRQDLPSDSNVYVVDIELYQNE